MLDLTASIRDALRQRSEKMRHHLAGGALLKDDVRDLCRGVARRFDLPFREVRAEAIEIGLPDPGEEKR